MIKYNMSHIDTNSMPNSYNLKNRIKELEKQIDSSNLFKKTLEDTIKFEKFLSELSFQYSGLPTTSIDKNIQKGLQKIAEFLGADRCSMSLFSVDKREVNFIYAWEHEGLTSTILTEDFVETKKYFPWCIDRLTNGEIVIFRKLEEIPIEAAIDKKNFISLGVRSHASIPIKIGGKFVGSIGIFLSHGEALWAEERIERLRLIGEIFANALVRKQKELDIKNAFEEIKQLKEQLEADCTYLREEIDLEHNPHNMIGQSDTLKQVLLKVKQVAPTDITVLIYGETGTGKELVARAVHDASHFRERPMVKVNCAALPANLIESELFGHEKGAFTSAQTRQVGRFELANRNTLFLDEIGELPLESQSKLLRVLQDGEFERLGSSRTIKVDVRVVAATNRDLEEEVKKGRFRQDLWYRLNIFPILIPPLRQRKDDIPLLVDWFVDKISRKMGKTIKRIHTNTIKSLQSYSWPGNVRELENVIERAVVNSTGSLLQIQGILPPSSETEELEAYSPLTLEEVETNHIVKTLEKTNGRVDGPKGAALILGLNPSTLRTRMRKLRISKSISVRSQ